MTSGEVQVVTGLSGTVGATLPAGLVTASAPVNDTVRQTLTYGTGSGYIDTFVATQRVLNPGQSVTIDLFGGADLTDAATGDPATFRTVKFCRAWVDAGGDTSGVRVGGAASNCWLANFADTSDMAVIYPSGGPWVADKPAGIEVSSSSKNLKFENIGSATATVAIYIGGSAAVGGVPMGLLLGLTYP